MPLEVGTETITVTVNPPPLVTDSVQFSNLPLAPGAAGTQVFQPYPSVELPPVVVPLTFVSNGKTTTTTRTVPLPPWPQKTWGAPGDPGRTTRPHRPNTTPISHPTSTSSTTRAVLPVWLWRDSGALITPITRHVDYPEREPDGGAVVPCNVWFFDLCIQRHDLDVKGWKLSLPEGRVGPGPPPPGYVKFPDWDVHGPLPPWPQITVGPDGVPRYPEKPTSCETRSASLCSTTTTFGIESGGRRTTATEVKSVCATVYGCQVSDENEATATDVGQCTLARREVARGVVTMAPVPTPLETNKHAHTTGVQSSEPTIATPKLLGRAKPDDHPDSWQEDAAAVDASRTNDCGRGNYVIHLKNPQKFDRVLRRLQDMAEEADLVFKQISSRKIKFTAFFYVEGLPETVRDKMAGMTQVANIHDPLDRIKRITQGQGYNPETNDGEIANGTTTSPVSARSSGTIVKRDYGIPFDDWGLSQVSAPRFDKGWYGNPDYVVDAPDNEEWGERFIARYNEESAGKGQTVYGK